MAAGDIIAINENAFGKKGNYYDGANDYVLHDAHAVARVAANDTVGTYSAWIYIEDLTITNAILSAGDNDTTNEFLEFTIDNGGRLRIRLNHGGAIQFNINQTTATMLSRKWYHVAIVQNGIQPKLYIDGKNISTTNSVSTDLTMWYNDLTLVDKFAIGISERNATHTNDFKGAIGQVKYWSLALSADQIKTEANSGLSHSTAEQTILDAALQFNVTYENDGTTDSGLGADNGTLTGNAYYGGMISDWSYAIKANVTGHAAEFINTLDIGQGKFLTLIKRGD